MEGNDDSLIMGEFYKNQKNGNFLFLKKKEMIIKIAEYKYNKLDQMVAEYKIQSKEGIIASKINHF